MIKILICDDQVMVREGLKAILSTNEQDFTVVGMAHDGADALDLIPRLKPDVVLMDLKMPLMNGVQATRQIVQQYPHVKVLVLTTFDADEWVFDAIRAGASGYLLKDTDQQTLIRAIKDVSEGKKPLDPNITGKLMNRVALNASPQESRLIENLSERERELLSLLGEGLSNAEIARRLYLTEGTVRNYLSVMFEKLGVADRTQAAVLAIRFGLVNRAD